METSKISVHRPRPTFRQRLQAWYENLWGHMSHPVRRHPPFDPVDEASRESFPASDPPAYPQRPVF